MRSVFGIILLLPGLLGAQPTARLTSYVDPMIGTGGHGHTYPGATVPFGMVQLSPDNGREGWDWCSGYHYSDSVIAGFSHTHLSGTGCADLGDILMLPATSLRCLDPVARPKFSHATEKAEPGYYTVTLGEPAVKVELTATNHAGVHRYGFPKVDSVVVLLDLKRGQEDTPVETAISLVSPTLVTGRRFSSGWAADQRVFFAARFSRPIQEMLLEVGGVLHRGLRQAAAKDVRAALYFGNAEQNAQLLVKVGLSTVSEVNALRNLDTEVPAWSFDVVRRAAGDAWEKALGAVMVRETADSVKRVFYTALYHTLLAPTEMSDLDGEYRGADHRVHLIRGGPYYSTYSLWDTYRAAHPLYTLIAPARVNGMMNSMLAFEKESGALPVWQLAANETDCMVGYHAVPPLADAYLKGFRGFDAGEALAAMTKTSVRDYRGLKFYGSAASVRAIREGLLEEQALPASRVVLAGFAEARGGDTLRYQGRHPWATHALIVRATDGHSTMTWESAPVPGNLVADSVTFVWFAGLDVGRGGHAFTLSVNGDSVLDFHVARDSTERSWSVTGKDGARLAFRTATVDRFKDFFGPMVLTLPHSKLTPGAPVVLSVRGENGGSSDWYMTFLQRGTDRLGASAEFGMLPLAGIDRQWIRVDVDRLAAAGRFRFRCDTAVVAERVLGPGYSVVMLPVPPAKVERTVRVSVDLEGTPLWSGNVLLRPAGPVGYVPADKEGESVSKTLEYAIDDAAIGMMARAMGRAGDAEEYLHRALYYRNLFDPGTGFFRGRNLDGSWVDPFNPRFATEKQPEYTEGNAWQYLWLVPHDVPGLIGLLGGREKFATALDSLFGQSSNLEGTGAPPDLSGLIGLYAHGNEPSHHIAYLYDYCGQPWKTQAMVQRIMRDFYHTGPEGLCGNEDCGQMSAWYIFSALGFYPVMPVGGVYALGSPRVGQAEIAVENGRSFVVEASGLTDGKIYIQSATLNGAPLTRAWITHDEIMKGGRLVLVMGARPNMSWGVAEAPPVSVK